MTTIHPNFDTRRNHDPSSTPVHSDFDTRRRVTPNSTWGGGVMTPIHLDFDSRKSHIPSSTPVHSNFNARKGDPNFDMGVMTPPPPLFASISTQKKMNYPVCLMISISSEKYVILKSTNTPTRQK
jgi:hypothetical protein